MTHGNDSGGVFLIHKHEGETPLACMERFRACFGLGQHIPLTYAGRLDPLASGLLLVLSGEMCKRKEEFLGLGKVYEVDILFGVGTDTHDPLGMVVETDTHANDKVTKEILHTALQKHRGTFVQAYPDFSSKTINGTPMFAHARAGTLGDARPHQEVTISSLEMIGPLKSISGEVILGDVRERVGKVTGDFRQDAIIKLWQEALRDHKGREFPLVRVRVHASSGTYMRRLAHDIGQDLGIPALAYKIVRTQIGVSTKLTLSVL